MKNLTNNELADLLIEAADTFNSPRMRLNIREAVKRLRGEWIPIDKFLKNPVEGLCWIKYKGQVRDAWYESSRCHFYYSHYSSSCYMTECITHVIPIKQPEVPK